MFLRLDSKFTPTVVYALSTLWAIVKGVLKLFSLFNIVLFVWVLYFNTPLITAKVLLGLIIDFFRVAFETYKDYVARFFDYVISAADNGLKSVPKHPSTPVEYPDGGFIKQYREIFQMIKDLPPRPDYGETTRWYDFLRDKSSLNPFKPNNPIDYLDPENKTGGALHNTFSFIKDHWHLFAIGGGVVVLGGALWLFWEPVTTGVVAVGTMLKSGYEAVIGWLSSGGSGGSNSAPNPDAGSDPILGDVNNEPGIPLEDFTPRNRAGVDPLSDDDIRARVLSLRMPDSPRTSLSAATSEAGAVVDLNSTPSPASTINPDLWGRNSRFHFGEGGGFTPLQSLQSPWDVALPSSHSGSMGSDASTLGGSVGPATPISTGVPSPASSSSLGLSGLSANAQGVAQVVQSAAESSARAVDPGVIQNSPVLSQLNLSPAAFAPASAPASPAPLTPSFPSGPFTFTGGFGSADA